MTLFLVICFLFASSWPLLAQGEGTPGGVAGLAAQEAQKRQQQVKAAQTLYTAGSQAYADRSYGEAMDNFKAAFVTVPAVPAVADQRRAFFRRYQAAAYKFAQVKVEEARWQEAEATLTDVMATAQDNGMPVALIDPEIRTMLGELKSRDDRYNMSKTPQHLRDVDAVESKLILAKGYLELGDYDRAERSYQQVLAIDPYNEAARRGLEKVERHRLDYFDAALNQTRAKMLREVSEAWESPVPSIISSDDLITSPTDVANAGSVSIRDKLQRIIIPRIEFNNARLLDVLEFLSQKSQELDVSESNPLKRGVNIVIDSSGSTETDDFAQRPLTVRLANIPLASALKYVTQQVNMKYRVDNFAVTVIPEGVNENAGLQSRTFPVPPGFISGGEPGGGGADPANPFDDPDPTANGIQIKRISAEDFLKDNGINFGDGASATFNAATSTLIVRNTADELMNIESLVQSARESGSKMVKVNVKLISVEEVALNQMGLDWLLGTSNFGSTPRVFFGGGVDGNVANGVIPQDFVFNTPGGVPVGMNPISSGLRTGDLATTQSINDILNRANPSAGSRKAPGIFSIAGVFTDPQFQMVLRALDQVKGKDRLSDTGVLVRPGQIAKIEQAREFIYPTEYDPPEIPNNIGQVTIGNVIYIIDTPVFPAVPAQPTAFETRQLGTVIEVEPTVSADNLTINLNVTADFSDFTGFINYGTPIRNARLLTETGDPLVVTENRILMPVFDSIKETTNVTVWDGQTIAIGGYHGQSITGSEDKIPFVGDLPGVGAAFRSRTNDSSKQALLMFVTVQLVDPGGNPINAPAEDPDLVTRQNVPTTRPIQPVGPPLGQSAGAVYPTK